MALGPGHYEGRYDAAKYVDKILRGANPAELQVAGPTEFSMSVNRTALKNLGLLMVPILLLESTNGLIDPGQARAYRGVAAKRRSRPGGAFPT